MFVVLVPSVLVVVLKITQASQQQRHAKDSNIRQPMAAKTVAAKQTSTEVAVLKK